MVAVILLLPLTPASHAREQEGYALWVANPLTNVFKDYDHSKGEVTREIHLEAARNEYEPFQICVTARVPVSVRIGLHPFSNLSGYSIGAENLRYEFVEYVPVRRNTPNTDEAELLRKAPGEFPDPLVKGENIEVKAGETRAIWFTLYVPPDAPSGRYEGTVDVIVNDETNDFNVHLDVYPFELPEKGHLWVTNWFGVDQIAEFHGVELWSENFWRILRAYAKNMAEHRQNVVWVDPNLIKAYMEENGDLSFDYSEFDKFVDLFESEGVAERIEIKHLARKILLFRIGELPVYGPGVEFYEVPVLSREDNGRVDISPENVLRRLLPDLQEHLDEKGWLDKSMVHIADEPELLNLKAYNYRSAFVKNLAPKIKRVDAILTGRLDVDLDIWVPILDQFHRGYDHFSKKMGEGAEVWFYTCCFPRGRYPNRFIDFPLLKTRILQWLNFRYDAVGYLHWGWNWWTENPFENVEVGPWPPGDGFIVYPGPSNSIRWEQMREGLEDYEYLWLLQAAVDRVRSELGVPPGEYDPSLRPKEFCGSLIDSPTDYTKDPRELLRVRGKVASEISMMEKRPLLLVKTDPPSVSPIEPGPVEIKGWVEHGTSVNVNGEEVAVEEIIRVVGPAIGTFSKVVEVSPKKNVIEIVANLNGESKVWVVEFRFEKPFAWLLLAFLMAVGATVFGLWALMRTRRRQ